MVSLEDKLLSILHHLDWKISTTLREEIEEKYSEVVAIGEFCSVLRKFLDTGLVVEKQGDDPEVTKKRDGKAYKLYRLSPDGLIRRHEKDQKRNQGIFGGRLPLPVTGRISAG